MKYFQMKMFSGQGKLLFDQEDAQEIAALKVCSVRLQQLLRSYLSRSMSDYCLANYNCLAGGFERYKYQI